MFCLSLKNTQKTENQNKHKTNKTKKKCQNKTKKKTMELIIILIFLNACFIFIKKPVENWKYRLSFYIMSLCFPDLLHSFSFQCQITMQPLARHFKQHLDSSHAALIIHVTSPKGQEFKGPYLNPNMHSGCRDNSSYITATDSKFTVRCNLILKVQQNMLFSTFHL